MRPRRAQFPKNSGGSAFSPSVVSCLDLSHHKHKFTSLPSQSQSPLGTSICRTTNTSSPACSHSHRWVPRFVAPQTQVHQLALKVTAGYLGLSHHKHKFTSLLSQSPLGTSACRTTITSSPACSHSHR